MYGHDAISHMKLLSNINVLITKTSSASLLTHTLGFYGINSMGEHSGSVVECLTRDRGALDLSLTGVTALWSLSKTHLS